jgi:ABC-type phosphate/phosphonate transport system permease subunit
MRRETESEFLNTRAAIFCGFIFGFTHPHTGRALLLTLAPIFLSVFLSLILSFFLSLSLSQSQPEKIKKPFLL